MAAQGSADKVQWSMDATLHRLPGRVNSLRKILLSLRKNVRTGKTESSIFICIFLNKSKEKIKL